MVHAKADRPGHLFIAAALGAALVGATLLSPMAINVAEAQTEPATAANGVLLPPLDFDPAAARSIGLIEGAADPAASAPPVDPGDGSAVTGTPEAVAETSEGVTDTPDDGSSTTTSLGGSDVAVSSVGGSHEVDRPGKRSRK